MLRPVLALAGVAVVGVVLWKLVWLFVLPFVGMFLGLLILAAKVLVIVGLVYLAYRLYRKWVVGSAAAS
jgi:hypothetical protein